MPRAPELSGITIVGAGAFNPAIVHPLWLADKKLIPEELAHHATQAEDRRMVVSPQLASFVADWLTVQVTHQQAIMTTVDLGREKDLRDFARSFFELLPETPVDAIGINADSHFRTDSESEWHAFGDRFLPKDFWESLFIGEEWRQRADGKRVGMRVMTVEVNRKDTVVPGYTRVELAPSVRITPNGVYIGINAHYQLSEPDRRSNAGKAARVLIEQWDATRKLESNLITSLLEAV